MRNLPCLATGTVAGVSGGELVEIERGADRFGERGLLLIQQPPDLCSERAVGDGRDVVARDDTSLVQSVGSSDWNFGRYAGHSPVVSDLSDTLSV